MTSLQDIFAAAQALPVADRVQLLHQLWNTLPPDQWAPPSESWLSEANRRSDAIDAGEMPTEDWEVVRQRVRRKAGLDG